MSWITDLRNHLEQIKGSAWTNENLTTIDSLIDAIKVVTDALPDGGALTSLLADITSILADTGELQTDLTNGGRLDLLIDGIKAATDNLPVDPADESLLEALFTALKGAGWTDENLTTIDANIDTVLARATEARLAELDAANIPADLDAVLADTNELQTDLTNGGRLDLLIDGIKAATDNLPTDPADESLLEAAISTTESNIRGVDSDSLKTLSDQIDALDMGTAQAAVAVTQSVTTTEADVLNLATAGHVYQLEHLRLKLADPGADSVTVSLYEEINNVETAVDTFSIDTNNFGSYHSLADMFGLDNVWGEIVRVSVQASGGAGIALTGQYLYADATL